VKAARGRLPPVGAKPADTKPPENARRRDGRLDFASNAAINISGHRDFFHDTSIVLGSRQSGNPESAIRPKRRGEQLRAHRSPTTGAAGIACWRCSCCPASSAWRLHLVGRERWIVASSGRRSSCFSCCWAWSAHLLLRDEAAGHAGNGRAETEGVPVEADKIVEVEVKSASGIARCSRRAATRGASPAPLDAKATKAVTGIVSNLASLGSSAWSTRSRRNLAQVRPRDCPPSRLSFKKGRPRPDASAPAPRRQERHRRRDVSPPCRAAARVFWLSSFLESDVNKGNLRPARQDHPVVRIARGGFARDRDEEPAPGGFAKRGDGWRMTDPVDARPTRARSMAHRQPADARDEVESPSRRRPRRTSRSTASTSRADATRGRRQRRDDRHRQGRPERVPVRQGRVEPMIVELIRPRQRPAEYADAFSPRRVRVRSFTATRLRSRVARTPWRSSARPTRRPESGRG